MHLFNYSSDHVGICLCVSSDHVGICLCVSGDLFASCCDRRAVSNPRTICASNCNSSVHHILFLLVTMEIISVQRIAIASVCMCVHVQQVVSSTPSGTSASASSSGPVPVH